MRFCRFLTLALFAITMSFTACGDDDSSNSAYNSDEESSSSACEDCDGSSSSTKSSSSSGVPEGYVDPSTVVKGTMTDERDGQTYKTVTIGTQTWMAENLNYNTLNSSCSYRDTTKCSEYGRGYSWSAAKNACPSGWRLPTRGEFEILFTAIGGQETAGALLKSSSGWYDNGNGSDAYSFAALPSGDVNDNGIIDGNEGYSANFWSSSESQTYSEFAIDISLSYDKDYAAIDSQTWNMRFSVRCVRDE